MATLNCIKHGKQPTVCMVCHEELKAERDRLAAELAEARETLRLCQEVADDYQARAVRAETLIPKDAAGLLRRLAEDMPSVPGWDPGPEWY